MKKSILVALAMSALLVSGCGSDPTGDISEATGLSKDQAGAVLTQLKVVKSKDGSVLISGTVDAQNSFGAKLRRGFMVTVDANKQVSSVNFL